MRTVMVTDDWRTAMLYDLGTFAVGVAVMGVLYLLFGRKR